MDVITLLVTFIVAHIGVILGGLVGAGGLLFGLFSHKSAQATKAVAAASVAQVKEQVAAGNAEAAQTGQTDAANMLAANQQAASTPDAGLDAELNQLGALRKD
jgi:hypothetical protein